MSERLGQMGNYLLIGALGASVVYMVYSAVEAQKRIDDPGKTDVPTHTNDYKKDTPIMEIKQMSENGDHTRHYWEIKQIECLQNNFDPFAHPQKAVFWLITMRQGHMLHVNMSLNKILARCDPKYKPMPPSSSGGPKSNVKGKQVTQFVQIN